MRISSGSSGEGGRNGSSAYRGESLKVCLDTDVFVEALRDSESSSAELVRRIGGRKLSGFVSFITVAELYVGAYLTKRVDDVDAILGPFDRLRLNDSIAKKAGELRATTSMSLPDCLIGSSALLSDVIFVTRNVKHFSRIKGLKVKRPEDLL